MIKDYQGKKVLIFGLGINGGGVGSALFFAKQGAVVRITDLKDKNELSPSINQLKSYPGIEYSLGGHKNEDIDWADLIIKNPGVKPDNPYIAYAFKKGKRVEMEMGIFLEYADRTKIVGVTGTKGKSTTASLIFEICKAAGKKVLLAGNIGKSVLLSLDQIEEDTLIILELSSFQLEAWDMHKTSPKWAVITNILPDHLNYYRSMEEYIQAKRVIAKYQTSLDYLFLRLHDPVTATEEFEYDLSTIISYFSVNDLPKNINLKLSGKHNLENAAAALSVAESLNIPTPTTLAALEAFSPIAYRMQLIYQKEGIKIYNDSASTNPDAASAALNSLTKPILITGGMNKNLSYKDYAALIDESAKSVYFLEGDASEQIQKQMKNSQIIKGTFSDIEKLLTAVKREASANEVIVFSPGATSFNLFQNEWDRGDTFNRAVEKIFP